MISPVWLPDEAHEALRNLVRARADATADLLRAKHRLSKFLLRQVAGHPSAYTTGPSGISPGRISSSSCICRIVFFADYLAEVNAATERVKRLEVALHQCAQSSSQVALIRGLQAFRGSR